MAKKTPDEIKVITAFLNDMLADLQLLRLA